MEQILDYTWFTNLPFDEQIDWVDNFDAIDIAKQYTSPSLRLFFRTVFEKEENTYLQKRAIECVSDLTFINVLREEFTKALFLDDISLVTDSFVGSTRLKYLFLLFGDDPDVYQEITKESFNPDVDIAAEALFRKGLIHLLYRSSQQDDETFLQEMSEADQFFIHASKIDENRVDAIFFSYVSQYLTSLLAYNLATAREIFDRLSLLMWQRQVWGWRPVTDLYEWTIYQALTNLRVIIEQATIENKWHDFKKELTLICKRFNDIIALDVLKPRFKASYAQFSGTTIDVILNRYYEKNLSASVLRIDSLIGELTETEIALAQFLRDLKERLKGRQQKKKDNLVERIAELHLLFPHVNISILTHEFNKIISDEGIEADKVLLRLVHQYIGETRFSQTDYITGYPISERVLRQLEGSIHQLLPEYPPRWMAAFLGVLADIIRYAYQSLVENRAYFALLYDSSITDESSFHEHLLLKLKASGRAAFYFNEDSRTIGAGRIDIVYRDGDVLFPIEVKKTSTKPSWDTIRSNYLTQAQTYVHPYNQLGFLITFDLSPKKDDGPINSFGDLFKILQMKSFYDIPNRNPDYIIAVIIPGNKNRPSEYTTYQR
ncbi:MAG: hypothetical protein EOO85_10925 [Pedobacter sp.]|nr:MAG: hypothetical protein EOO85_10925 [Pedobacter sp.]